LISSINAEHPFTRKKPVVIAAAGNESRRPGYTTHVAPPAAGNGIIAVGALGQVKDKELEVAYFSNTQPQISAPGVDIISAKMGGGLVTMSGTSMATPHVAGIAALWTQYKNENRKTGDFVRNKLVSPKESDFEILGSSNDIGDGLVQAPSF